MDVAEPPAYGSEVSGSQASHPTRKREDVQKMKTGLFAALQELRCQNDDLTSHIDVLGKATSESAKTRAETESALIRTIKTAETVRIRRRLPHPPLADATQTSQSPSPVEGDDGSVVNQLTKQLKEARMERDEAKAELSRKEELISNLSDRLTAGSPRCSVDAKEVSVRNEIKALLEQRAEELQAQLRQLELENAVLIRRVTESDDLLAEYHASLCEMERKTKQGDETSVQPSGQLLESLEQALDQRDEALEVARLAEADRHTHALEAQRQMAEMSRALKETESRLFTLKLGFENASQMMVSFSAALEAKVNDGKLVQAEQLSQIRALEEQRLDQDRLVSELLRDLEKERTRVANSTEDDAMEHAILLLRAKQAENQAHAALADKYRALASDSGDNVNGADAQDGVGSRLQLPAGWDVGESPEGLTYYINHYDQTTSWAHPGFSTAIDDPELSKNPHTKTVSHAQAHAGASRGEGSQAECGKQGRRQSRGWRPRLSRKKKSACAQASTEAQIQPPPSQSNPQERPL